MSPRVEFAGNDRYEVVRRLGAGGLGLVYEVLDRERNARVALKTFRAHDTAGLLRLKHEFRSSQNLSHPNLVSLYELFADDEQCFFTMELVDGVDFLRWVRPPGGARDGDAPQPDLGAGPTLHVPRLRATLTQLASAVQALHQAGKLHRDLKPANVLVTSDGRAVLLDFGLVVEFVAPADARDSRVVGTVDYMAPEQAASQPVGPPADWYAIGTMLYQALTGDLPFRGAPLEVLARKRERTPVAVQSINPQAPAELATLCMRLLAREPHARPTGVEVLAALSAPTMAVPSALPIVGHQPYLDELDRALHSGGSVVVHGDAGVGKSALLQAFVARARQRLPSLVVLAGRIHQREVVPLRGVDGVIDALARYLLQLPAVDVAHYLWPEPAALYQLFPVLRRAHSVVARTAKPDPEAAGLELRGVLARLAAHTPLLIVVDDLQWADPDSLVLLAALTAPPPQPWLFVGAVAEGAAQAALDLSARLLDLSPLWAARLQALDDDARRVLHLVAVADAPLSIASLASPAGLEHDQVSRAVSLLRQARLVSTPGLRRTDLVQLAHPSLRRLL